MYSNRTFDAIIGQKCHMYDDQLPFPAESFTGNFIKRDSNCILSSTNNVSS